MKHPRDKIADQVEAKFGPAVDGGDYDYPDYSGAERLLKEVLAEIRGVRL